MSPQNPKAPDELSLQPSKSADSRPADFSNVQGHADTVPGTRGGGGGGGKPDFSNVESQTDTVPGHMQADTQTYTVKPGDTLSAIAQQHYGKASRWHAIFEANRDQLDDPDLIRPGQTLKLPPAAD